MPSAKFHKLIERKVLGKEYNVGRLIDMPSKFLGSHHRKLFHDNKTIAIFLLKDKKLGEAAALHILMDKFFSGKKRYLADFISRVIK